MPAGVTNLQAVARPTRDSQTFAHPQRALLDNESSVDVSQTDSTINISLEHCQHVPSILIFRCWRRG